MLVMLCLLKMRIVWFLNRACSSGSLPSGAVYVRSSNTRRSPCACATGADGSTRPTARPARKTIANPPRDFLFSDMGALLRGQHRVTRCVEAMEGAIVAQILDTERPRGHGVDQPPRHRDAEWRFGGRAAAPGGLWGRDPTDCRTHEPQRGAPNSF